MLQSALHWRCVNFPNFCWYLKWKGHNIFFIVVKLSPFQLDRLLLNDTHMLLSIFSPTMFVMMSLFLFSCQQCSFLFQVWFFLFWLLFLFFEASLFVCQQIWFGGDRSSWKPHKIPKALMLISFLRKTGEIKLPP